MRDLPGTEGNTRNYTGGAEAPLGSSCRLQGHERARVAGMDLTTRAQVRRPSGTHAGALRVWAGHAHTLV